MRSWRRPYIPAIVFITAALAVSVLNGSDIPPGGGAGTANIWVDTSGGSCADSPSAISYQGDGTECATLNAAVQAAEPGDKIGIRAGVYAFETITNKTSLQGLSPGCDPYGEWGSATSVNCVEVFPDGDVWIRGLINNASSIWLHGTDPGSCATVATCNTRSYDFHISNSDLIGNPPPGATAPNCFCSSVQFRASRAANSNSPATRPDHNIIDSIDSDTLSIYGSSNVLVRNTDVGPLWLDNGSSQTAAASVDVPRIWDQSDVGGSRDIVWDNVFVHEVNRTFNCDINNACHGDGLYITRSGPITIRDSLWTQVMGQQLFFEAAGTIAGASTSDFLIENSYIGCIVQSYPDAPATARTTCSNNDAFEIKRCDPTCSNFLIRYNTFAGITGTATGGLSNVRFVGNVSRQPPSTSPLCSGASFQYNVMRTTATGGSCGLGGTNATITTLIFTSETPGSDNPHLAGASAADNIVTASTSDYTLTTDIDGDTRPSSGGSNPRDAGVDER